MSASPVERLWSAIDARNWDAAKEQLANDVVIDWPATGERFSGRDSYVEVQRVYPEGWSIEMRSIVREGCRVAVEMRVPHGDEVFFCAAFYELEDGRISRGVEHWSEGSTGIPPPWRAHLAEPLPDR